MAANISKLHQRARKRAPSISARLLAHSNLLPLVGNCDIFISLVNFAFDGSGDILFNFQH